MSTSERGYSTLPESVVSGEDFPEAYARRKPDASEGLQSVQQSEEKEVARTREDFAPEAYADAPEAHGVTHPAAPAELEASSSRRRRRWIYVGVALGVIAIALGVGLGVGLSRSPSSSSADSTTDDNPSDPTSTTTADGPQSTVLPRLPSAKGAFNGTDLAVTRQGMLTRDGYLQAVNSKSDALLFYQHYTGQIRWIQYLANLDQWYGGWPNTTVATDAKNNTPIDATMSWGSNFEVHMFYVDRNNLAREIFVPYNSATWANGSLNTRELRVLDSPRATLRAGRLTDSDSSTTSNSTTSSDPNACTRLFVSSTETQMKDLVQCPQGEWNEVSTWSNIDAQAPPAYYGWNWGGSNAEAVSYVVFIDLDGHAQLFWNDTNSLVTGVPTVASKWNITSLIAIGDLDPTAGLTGLSTHGTLIGRSAVGPLLNWNVVLDEADSTAIQAWSPYQYPVMAGSLVKATVAGSDRNRTTVYYQVTGDDITVAVGTPADVPTLPSVLPIPDD